MQFQVVPPRRKERLHEMHFLEHLDELRGVITASVLVFLAFAAAYFCFSGTIIEWMVRDVPSTTSSSTLRPKHSWCGRS
jgi:Sec-independent protein secretion pathway component TatC